MPELLIGIGLFGMGPVSQRLALLAGTGRLPAGDVIPLLHGIATLESGLGMGSVFMFVWLVFRREARWNGASGSW